MNKQLLDGQHESNSIVVSLAFSISLLMHSSLIYMLPWLEAVKTKLPVTIMAELQQPPPLAESNPIELPSKPEVVKVENQPKPTPKTQAVPVLASKRTEQATNDYSVPNIPQPATAPSEPTAPAAPDTSSAASESTTSLSKNVATSSSTNTWDDSDVWDEYGRNLQRLCERYKQYPAIAIRRSWQGLAKVLVRFSSEGKTLSVVIEKSTGQKVLDEQALEMVRKSLNDLPVPIKFKGREFRLSIPVDFKLE